MENKCKQCKYYHQSNDTCHAKKCSTNSEGYVTLGDRLFCDYGSKENT